MAVNALGSVVDAPDEREREREKRTRNLQCVMLAIGRGQKRRWSCGHLWDRKDGGIKDES